MVEIKMIGLSGKQVTKSECIMSDYVKHYKGRKIEVGLNQKQQMLVIFVDDIWLTGMKAKGVFPMTEENEEQQQQTADMLVKMMTVAETIIDRAVAYEQEEQKANRGYE
jgi:hypothetical protein